MKQLAIALAVIALLFVALCALFCMAQYWIHYPYGRKGKRGRRGHD